MIKNIALLASSLFILMSCSHLQTNSGQNSVPESAVSDVGTKAIFHVIEPLGVELILLNVKDQKEVIVLMDKTLSKLELEPGHWQVSGFILDKKSYRIMNSSKRFIFRLKKDKITYVGSYIFQCPKVNNSHLKEMRKMNFFNRYPFSSKTGLCELVVGSDFEKVNEVWVNLDLKKHRRLSLGF